MKFLIKNKNPIRSLLAILACGNIIIFYVISHGFWPKNTQEIFIFYNLICSLILFGLSRRQLSVEIMSDYMLVTRLLSTKKIRNSDIKSIEVQSYGAKKNGNMCRLGVNGSFPVIFTEDMFEDDRDYNALVKCLGWVEKKYSHHNEPSWKGIASACSKQLVTYSVVFIMIILNSILFFINKDDFLWIMDNFAFSKSTIEFREYYRFITAFFLHLNPVHLLINLISLGVLGGMLEQYFGRAKYFNILILSTFSGWIFSLAFSPFILVVGASGGIFGLFGSYIALKILSKEALQPSVDPMPFWWAIIILIFQVISDLYIHNSDFYAHIGGVIGGSLYFIVSRFTIIKSIKTDKLISLVIFLLCIFSFFKFIH